MDGVMSQEEINALLSSGIIEAASPDPEPEAEAAEQTDGELMTDQEKDAIGEISNISLLIDQAHDRLLEQEQFTVGWE